MQDQIVDCYISLSLHPSPPSPSLLTFFQSIEDTQQQPQPSKKPLPQVSSSRLETAGSTASGPASTSGPLSITSQEEEIPEPDPNATYASVSRVITISNLMN